MHFKRLLPFVILGAALFISAVLVGNAFAQRPAPQRLAELVYPIKELGSCTDPEDCAKFCDDPKNLAACVSFARRNRLMEEGELDRAEKFVAAGGTDNQVYLFKNKEKAGSVELNEYVAEIDVSANGKYIAAGTGGSVYFFESFTKNLEKIFPCTTVIEPPSEAEAYAQYGDSGGFTPSGRGATLIDRLMGWFRTLFTRQDSSRQSPPKGIIICGNDLCEPGYGETKETCADDCIGED